MYRELVVEEPRELPGTTVRDALVGDQGVEPPESEGGRSTDITFNVDIFDAVVVAAFGGVRQRLSNKGDGFLYVHPCLLLVLVCVLLVAQLTVILYLKLGQDLEANVWDAGAYGVLNATSGTFDDGRRGEVDKAEFEKALLVVKLVMVCVATLVQSKRLMQSVRTLVFLLNPTTWEDIERPDPQTMRMNLKCAYKSYCLALPAILAKLFHILIDYNIMVDAVSIILGSNGSTEVIYDSLAITFIAELGSVWWIVVAEVFHFEKFDDFKFRFSTQEMRENCQRNSRIPVCLKSRFPRRGRGARKWEVLATFLLMMYILERQLEIVAMAVDSNVLPVARDVCTFWRWNEHHSEYLWPLSLLFRLLERYILLHNPEWVIKRLADPGDRGYCTEEFDRMRISDEWKLFQHMYVGGGLFCIFFFMVLPQLVFACNHWIQKTCLGAHARDPDEDRMPAEETLQDPTVPRAVDDPVRTLESPGGGDAVEALMEALTALRQDYESLRQEQEGMRQEHARQQREIDELRGQHARQQRDR